MATELIEPHVTLTLFCATQILDDLKLRYAVVGGLAVTAWAVPRATRDADLWVALGDGRERLCAALTAGGFHVPAMDEELQRFGVFRSRHERTGVFVDIFDAVGPLGEAIIERHVLLVIGDVGIWLATAEDVAVLKAYSDRDRDFIDLVTLLEVANLDLEYIEQWARRLDASIGTNEVTQRIARAREKARV